MIPLEINGKRQNVDVPGDTPVPGGQGVLRYSQKLMR